jgi:ribonuclease Z
MPLQAQVLGARGADNAVLLTVDTGQQISRLLIDCGERIIPRISFVDSSSIQHLLFTHYHMDHVAGFDSYFRRHYDRADLTNHIWGPPGTAEIMGHRYRGYVWNLIGDRQATWISHDIYPHEVTTARHELSEAFALKHDEPSTQPSPLITGPGYSVEAISLNHGNIPSIGYKITEHDRWNVDSQKLQALGLKPGPWLREMQTQEHCIIDGQEHQSAALRQQLLIRSPGLAIAYLTDFIAEAPAEQQRLVDFLQGVDQLICECQYSAADADLARKNSHMTTRWVGQLAAKAQVKRLALTHFSQRYTPVQWEEMVEEVKQHFANTELPDG